MTTAERKSKSVPLSHTLFGAPPSPDEEQIERYPRPVRILHWANAIAWIVLFITGLFFFVNQFGAAAQGGVSGVFHRIAAVVMVGWVVLFVINDPKGTVRGIREALKWGRDDLEWAKAAVSYYFFGREDKMPPQEHMNTGQKLWWLTVIVVWAVMIITGALMWFFKDIAPQGVFNWAGFFHDVGFAILLPFALLHVYLSAFHPKMRGVFWSMWRGNVSAKYAESHHKKWYDRVKKGEKA